MNLSLVEQWMLRRSSMNDAADRAQFATRDIITSEMCVRET